MQLLNTTLIVSTMLFFITTSWASDRDMIIEPQPVSVSQSPASENATVLLKEPPGIPADQARLENTPLQMINSSRTPAEQSEPVSEYDPMLLIGPPGIPADQARLENTPLQMINSSRTPAEQSEPVSEYDPMLLIGPPGTQAEPIIPD